MNRDVFLSILAMDSYNRGYGAGVSGLSESGKLGTASIREFKTGEQNGWQTAGFYAIAYDWNGQTVISFRGTDFTTAKSILQDVFNGWSSFTGIGTNTQFGLARQFSKAVNGFDFPVGLQYQSTALITGHSLGGALAGYVAARSGGTGVLFDPIPYRVLTQQEIVSEALIATIDELDLTVSDVIDAITLGILTSPIGGSNITLQKFSDTFVANFEARSAFYEKVSGFSMSGEIAADIAQYQIGIGAAITPLFQSLGISQLLLGIQNATSGERNGIVTVPNYAGLSNPISLHSMSLMSISLFGEKQWSEEQASKGNWVSVAPLVLTHVNDAALGQNFGLVESGAALADSGEQMARMIAYSAINEGSEDARPFGDTGIRALFDDSNDFGLANNLLPSIFNLGVKTQLGRIITEFAGLLATTKTMSSQVTSATAGILAIGGESSNPDSLSIDLSKTTWHGIKTGYESIVAEGLINALVVADGGGTSVLPAIKGWYSSFHGASGSGDLIKDIEEIIVSLKPGVIFGDNSETGLKFHIGTNSSDNFQFSQNADFVLGAGGADTIWGLGGTDILLGGEGADTLAGGAGNDWISGGEGNDIIWGDDVNGNGQVGNDTAFYGADIGSTHLSYNGRLPNAPLTVATNRQGKDTLYGIEEVILTGGAVSFSLTNHIAESTYLTVRAGPTTGTNLQLIDAAELTGGATFRFNIANGGGSSIYDKSTTGQINLYGFNTQIVGTEFDDDIIDGSTASKILSGGQGNDTLQVNFGNSALFGGQGDDTITGGIGNDILIAGEGTDTLRGGSGADLIMADMQNRRTAPLGSSVTIPQIDGGAGSDYIYLNLLESNAANPVSLYVRGGSGNDYVRINSNDISQYTGTLADGSNYVTDRVISYRYSVGSAPSGPFPGPTAPGDGNDHIILENNRLAQNSFELALENASSATMSYEFEIKSYEIKRLNIGSVENMTEHYQATYIGTLLVKLPNGNRILIENAMAGARGTDAIALQTMDYSTNRIYSFGFGGMIQGTSQTGFLVLQPDSLTAVVSQSLRDKYKIGPVNTASATALADFYAQSGLPAPTASPAPAPLARTAMAAAAASAPIADTFGTESDDSFNYERGNRTIDGGDGNDLFSLFGDITDYIVSAENGVITVADRWGLIGKTQLLNFEGVHSLADARTYSLDDILNGQVPHTIVRLDGDGADNELIGTDQRDRINGFGGNDMLSGADGDDALDGGTGNDRLVGGIGNDRLVGGSGLDEMAGGLGDDRYDVDNVGDQVVEALDAGRDAVFSSIDLTLAANVEDLFLQGAAVSGIGNSLDNAISGTSAANILAGGDGSDFIFGMAGDDSIAGDSGDDRLYGGDGNDSLRGGLGDDHVDGGADLGGTGDTAIFDGLRSDYTIEQLGDGSVRVTAINGGLDGSDRISNVERLAFLGEPEATRFVVLRKPELAGSLTALTILEDTAFNVDLPVSQFSDPAGGALSFRVRQSDGSPLPEWLSFNGSTFSGTPPANYSGTIALDVKVIGGEGVTSVPMTFVVQNVNDAPYQSATIPDLTIPAGGTSGMGVIGYFTDPDNNSLTPSVTLANGDPVPSWLFVNSGKGLTITPPAGNSGHYIVRVTVSDGLATASGTFRLTYGGGGNSAPVLNLPLNDATVDGGSAISIPIPAGTFKDANADTLNFTASLADGSALPAWLSFVNGQLSGTAPTGATNTYSIKITASDGLTSAFDLFDLTVNSSNSAPILVAPITDVTSPEDTPVNFVVPANTFSDVDGDSLTYTAVLDNGSALPAWLSFDGERFTGTPPANFNGVLTIRVTASDGLSTATDVFDLAIDRVNDAPVVQTSIADLFGDEDAGISFSIPATTFLDVDGDILAITAELIDGEPLPSWLAFDGRRFSGTPPTDFDGALDIRVRGSDGSASATDTFRLTINPMNDPPVQIAPLAMQVSQEDTYIDVALDTSAFADVDGDSLSFTARMQDGSALPAWLHFDGSRFTGNPPQDYNGVLALAVTASDGQAQIIADFSLAISPVNDVPVQLSALPPISALEDQPLSVTLPGGIFADADGDVLTYSARLTNGEPLPGWLQFDGLTFSGTPPQDFNGQIDLFVSASDGSAQVDATLRLAVFAVNDAPVLSVALIDQSVLAGDPLSFAIPVGTFADIDGDALSFTATLADGSLLPTWLSFDGQRLIGTPPSAGTFDVRITASDGSATASDVVTLAVLPRNRAPDAQDDGLFVTDQSQRLVIAAAELLANDSDPDGDTLRIVSVQGAAHGTVSIAANGDILYTPNGTYVGSDSFSYTLSDGTTIDVANVSVLVESPFANWTQGTAGNDKLFGNMAMTNQIFGGAGSDMIKGGQQDDMLAGGDGNDHLIGLGGNDHFWGGAGNDLINGNSGQDYAHYAGLRSSYSIVTVNGNVTVVDNAPTQDGNDGTDTISSIEQLVFKNGETASVISPIVLDLDGRGVQTLSASASKARYDFNGDGRRDDTSWIGATEGFLFLDRDGNGTLSGANELSFIDDLPGARSDLDGLRAFDSDGNGRLAAGDGMFAKFRVWRDGDGDGIVDSGEVMTLAQAGVKAINLTGNAVNGASAFGEVAVVNQGSYERTDGSAMQFVDSALTYFTAPGRRPETARMAGRRDDFTEFERGQTGAPNSGIDFEAAIAALSASSGSNSIAALVNLSDAETFARFSDSVASAKVPSEVAQRSGRTRVAAMTIDPASQPEWSALAQPNAGSIGGIASDRTLALLRQDMAGFTGSAAMARIDWNAQSSYQQPALSMI